MAKARVCWWEINAKDGGSLAKFYEELFDWDLHFDDGTGIWGVDSGGKEPGTISGGIFTGKGALPTHRCLYVEVPDIDAVCAKAKKAGRVILQGPFDVEGGLRLAFFEDPEGHMIGLMQREREAVAGKD